MDEIKFVLSAIGLEASSMVAGIQPVRADTSAQSQTDCFESKALTGIHGKLRVAFPVLFRLVGSENFGLIVNRFCRIVRHDLDAAKHPVSHFCRYIERLGLVGCSAFLADITRLEMMIYRAEHDVASGSVTFSPPADLAQGPYLDHAVELAASTELFMSRTGSVTIWRHYSCQDITKKCRVTELDDAALVVRQPVGATVMPLEIPGCDVFIANLKRGHTIAEACEGALFIAPGFALTKALEFLAETLAICALRPGPSSLSAPSLARHRGRMS